MICKEKVEALKQKEIELSKELSNRYILRIKTSIFGNLSDDFDYPEYSFITPTTGREKIRLYLNAPPIHYLLSLDRVMQLYDSIATRVIEVLRGYDSIIAVCKSNMMSLPANKDAIIGGKFDYEYKLALNVIGAAMVECTKVDIGFDQLPEKDMEEILIANSFMMFDICSIDGILIPEARVVSNLDNFIIPPKHTDKDEYTLYLCS